MQDWSQLPDEALLKIRIKDLGLSFEKSDVSPLADKVLQELSSQGLTFKPRIYFGDEWFSPEGVPAVSVPFFLAHPRLRALEKKFMLECEGESPQEFAKLFRHELGHAFDHAFKASRRKSWAKIFGSPKKEYQPETYRPRPYSRNYVHNIGRWYAQAHPDEDFAETFAVWLDPESNWQKNYRSWGAIKKINYLDSLAIEFKNKSVTYPRGRMISDASHLQSTLKHYYEKKKREFAENYPDFFDKDLHRIFSHHLEGHSAAAFMRQNKKDIVHTIAHWTGEKKVTISELVGRLIKRCADLKLTLSIAEPKALLEISAFLATLVSHYLFTGHFRRRV